VAYLSWVVPPAPAGGYGAPPDRLRCPVAGGRFPSGPGPEYRAAVKRRCDVVRTDLSKGLGFRKEHRDTNIRRIGFESILLTGNSVIAIAWAISPYRAVRDEVRQDIGDFVEVHGECPLDELPQRDVKGLYAKAIKGEIAKFTGISDPHEPPLGPEVTLHTTEDSQEASLSKVLQVLE
jgi:adenylyl-sulfate kinase